MQSVTRRPVRNRPAWGTRPFRDGKVLAEVVMKTVMEQAKVRPDAGFVIFEAPGGYTSSIPVEFCLRQCYACRRFSERIQIRQNSFRYKTQQ
jgi:hypothetical protein